MALFFNYVKVKKRHQQKLVGLSLLLCILWNIPFLAIFNIDGAIYGFPILYLDLFISWLVVSIIAYTILSKHYE